MERFWNKVKFPDYIGTDECWEWQAYRTKNGYGGVWLRGEMTRAHRFSYEISVGTIPLGLCVLHRCDNRLCVNPAHLFLGTKTDNARDMCQKGRQAHVRGEAHGLAKLTEADVIEIRRLYATGDHPQREIGALFGVCQVNVGDIVNGDTWAHIKNKG